MLRDWGLKLICYSEGMEIIIILWGRHQTLSSALSSCGKSKLCSASLRCSALSGWWLFSKWSAENWTIIFYLVCVKVTFVGSFQCDQYVKVNPLSLKSKGNSTSVYNLFSSLSTSPLWEIPFLLFSFKRVLNNIKFLLACIYSGRSQGWVRQ